MRKKYQKLTVEEWIDAGRKLKTISSLLEEMIHLFNGKVPCSVIDLVIKEISARGAIPKLKSRLEDEMFRQHPSLSNEYFSVFYGEEEVHVPKGDA